MSNGGTNGFATALALALQGAGGSSAVDDVDQAEMFAEDLDAPAMLPPAAGTSGPKGGRPKGARNRSTEAIRQLFLAKFRHPMLALGELTARSPEELARELKLYAYHEGKPVLDRDGNHVLATGEAFKAQREALIALLPYLGQKLPQAIEVTPPRRGVVVIGGLDVGEAEDDLALPIAPEENQRLIEGEAVRLADEQSDAAPKPQSNLGEFKE